MSKRWFTHEQKTTEKQAFFDFTNPPRLASTLLSSTLPALAITRLGKNLYEGKPPFASEQLLSGWGHS